MDTQRGCRRCSGEGKWASRGYACCAHTSPNRGDAVPGRGRGAWQGALASLRSATAEPIGMRALGRRPRAPGEGPAPACGLRRLCSNGEACNPEGLAGGLGAAGKRDSLSRGRCLTTSSPLGWSGAPISLANQPGTGLIPGLCQVIPSLVHLLLCLMSPSPPKGAVEGVSCFSLCYCLKPHSWSHHVLVRSCAGRAVPASDPKP